METLVDSPLDGAQDTDGTSPHPVPPGLESGLGQNLERRAEPSEVLWRSSCIPHPTPEPLPELSRTDLPRSEIFSSRALGFPCFGCIQLLTPRFPANEAKSQSVEVTACFL